MIKLDKMLVTGEEVRHCPKSGNYCHQHSNPIRNMFHNLYCMLSECPESKLYQWAVRNDDPTKYKDDNKKGKT